MIINGYIYICTNQLKQEHAGYLRLAMNMGRTGVTQGVIQQKKTQNT